MKNKHVLSILTVVMLLMLTLIPVNCFAYYEAGAPTPEEAIEQFELGQAMFDAPMAFGVSYHGETIASAIRTYSTTEMVLHLLLNGYSEEEQAAILKEIIIDFPQFNGNILEFYIYSQSGIHYEMLIPSFQESKQKAIEEGKVLYTNEDLSFEFS